MSSNTTGKIGPGVSSTTRKPILSDRELVEVWHRLNGEVAVSTIQVAIYRGTLRKELCKRITDTLQAVRQSTLSSK